jgi:hypothetical protein
LKIAMSDQVLAPYLCRTPQTLSGEVERWREVKKNESLSFVHVGACPGGCGQG